MSSEIEILTELQCVSITIWNALKENNIQNLKAKEFRMIISCYKKLQTLLTNTQTVHTETLTQLSDQLLQVLTCGELNLDCQIVASTAYCLALTYHYDSEQISQKFLDILLISSFQSLEIDEIIDNKKYNMFKICLCHGILQCSNEFWFKPTNNSCINVLLNNEIFPIVCKLCFEYNSLCLISFKVLVNLIKKINTIDQDGISLLESNFKEVFNIVMSNWENPLSGVREQNLLVFEQLLMTTKNCWKLLPVDSTVLDEMNTLCPLLHLILTEISWMMKSKYFLLSAVLRRFGVNKIISVCEEDVITGLLTSLRFTQLVSAGSDLYQVITSTFTLDQWQNSFLTPISEALTQSSNKLLTENVINYWLPYTVKKYPTSLTCLLEKISTEQNDVNLFSYISLMKLARKEGFGIANWDNLKSSTFLIPALLSNCEKVRSQAFYLICVDSKSSVQPSEEEIKMVKMFLQQNINVDNAAMRHNLLNAFTTFIFRLRDSSLKEIRKHQKNDKEVNVIVDKCLDFLQWLHTFVVNNFQYDCNYQRKFTSLQIYNIILNSFCYKLRNNIVLQQNKKNDDIGLISNIGKTNGKWMFTSKDSQNILISNIYDPADDIRTLSAEILTIYFNIEESEIIYYKELLQNALKFCKNPMFYQAESGALLLQTIITLTSNSTSSVKEGILCDVFGDTVLDYLIQSVEEQFAYFSKDMLRATMDGSSLYGLLDALERLFSHHSSPQYQMLSKDQIGRIIVLIKNIVYLLLNVLSSKSDNNSDFAPSFAEMGIAIASLVQQSSVVSEDIQSSELIGNCDVNESNLEGLQLTPAQQLVLNCIWHNMKVCCSIASKLITTTCLNVNDAKHCMDLLCLVLCKCRHKGAIESAGLAIYQTTKFLTSSNKLEFLNIPREFILQFLCSLVSANSTTISRRSAGLAILIHRIAAGDMEQGKPLLHICVSRFIKVFDSFEEPSEFPFADLPQSRALHFLQTLVQDSSLRQEMAKYIVQISLLCFANLGSSIWTLRNAALQLFGALLPKLTGQKKIQEGETKGSCYHLAIEELYFHIKPLFVMIGNELSIASASNSLQIHSRMMPLLTLLSNFTVSFQCLLNVELRKICKHFSDRFQYLFKSEIYNVRELSAKANAWFCLPSEILDCIQNRIHNILGYVTKTQSTIMGNNELHGYLLNVKYLVSCFNETKIGNKTLCKQDEKLKTCLKELIVISKPNLVNQHSLIYNIFEILEESYNQLCLSNSEITDFNSDDLNLHCVINNCDSESIKSVLKHCIFSFNFDIRETCLNALKIRIKTKNCSNEYGCMIDVLNDALHNANCKSQVVELILEIMLEILNSSDIFLINIHVDNVYFDILYNLKFGSKCSALVLPVICGIVSKKCQFSFIDKVCSEIFQRSNPVFNEELRMSAAQSLFLVLPFLKNICDVCDSVGSFLWKSAVSLLRDEDKGIRLEVSKSVFTVFRNEFDKWIIYEYKLLSSNLSTIKNCNPFVALEFLFETTCLNKFMSEKHAILTMWKMLIFDEIILDKSKTDILNPFCNDKNNIYEEEVILIEIIQNSIISLIQTISQEDFLKVKHIILDQRNFKNKELDQVTGTMGSLQFKKLQCQSQIVDLLMKWREHCQIESS